MNNNIVSILAHTSREHPNMKTVWYTDTDVFAEYHDGEVYQTGIKEFSEALNKIENKRKMDEN